MRTTPSNITSLQPNEIFVFGSNLSGIHGGGAARLAHNSFGAQWGQGIGLFGQTYAIPTKSIGIERTISIEEIKPHVDDFITWAQYHNKNIFLVTEIGCGLAGYNPIDIAPLFEKAVDVQNIWLPNRFWEVLKNI